MKNYDDRTRAGEGKGPGWLGASIAHETGYGFRKGYKSKEELETEARLRAKREAERAEREAKRLEREKAKEQAEERRYVEFLESLGSGREAFQKAALDEHELILRQYRRAEEKGDGDGMKMYQELAGKSKWRKEIEKSASVSWGV